MSKTYHVLAVSDLLQDWSNSGLISTDDNWDNVPSIEGYRGDGLSSSTSTNPQTVTGTSAVIDVNANKTDLTFNTGGVAEFQISNPTVALQGSGTADAPYLALYLNATGRQNVTLSFNARELDADNAVQQVAVQYRIGDSGTWTNVPSGYIADASNGAGLVTAKTVTLPDAVNDVANLQVRIITNDAVGSDSWIGIDDIKVTSTGPQPVGQTVGFSASTVAVAHDEGDTGSTSYQFVVERTGGTTGDVAFSGTIASAQTDAADFVGGKPTSFNGTIAAGQTSATVTVTVAGDTTSEANETFALTLQNVSNSAAVATTIGSAAQATGTIVNDDVAITKISAIQGTGASSTMVGQTVTVDAIVVGDFQNGDGDNGRNLNGFYLQEQLTDSDGNLLTSEAIFVYGGTGDVQVGDRVRVTGTVSEYFGLTELTATSIAVVEAGAVADINTMATAIDLPSVGTTLSQDGDYQPDLEAYEGMLVTIPETLTITEQFNLDRFNEIKLVAGERPAQFTQENAPDAAAYQAYLAELGARTITYDDGLNTQNQPIANLDGFGPTYNTATAPRMGDTVNGLTGVLDYQWAGLAASGATWRIRSVEDGTNTFQDSATPRTAAPDDVGGTLKVASFNVLNFFKTLDNGASTAIGAEPRGAGNATEFARQTEKLVDTILSMNADVLALTELENDFKVGSSGNAIEYLVAQLNAAVGAGTYAWVNPGQQFVGGDAIAVGFIYKTAEVKIAAGTTVEILNDADLPGLGLSGLLSQSTVGHIFDGTNTSRNALAVTFEEIDTGETFTAIANHLKSKSGTGTGLDADQGDGQGNWQNQRELAATALTAWAQSDPTGSGDSDVLLLGDYNGYAKEQSTAIIEGAGYENLHDREEDAYSYVFDGQTGTLDYAFANGSLASQVTGVTTWHINADEADALDYNTDYSRDTAIFDADAPVRVSDHDPVIVGLDLNQKAPAPAYTLQILHASDFEAGLAAVDRAGNFAAIVDYLEETQANSITLSSGDNFIPSPFFNAGSDASLKEVYETALETYYHLAPGSLNITPGFGSADIAMLDIIGIQASAIGNHEFDAGTKAFADIIKQTAGFPGAQFPYLAADINFSGDPNLSSAYTSAVLNSTAYSGFPPAAGLGKKIAPATIIEEGGEKIGVVGATTQIVESISSTGGIDVIGDDVDDMVALAAILQPTIDGLIAQGINKIILVSHLQQLSFEQALAPLLHGVDVIVAGGSHTLLADETDALRAGDTAGGTYPIVTQNADGNTTLIVNTSGEYSYVGRLVVDFDANGNVIADSVDPAVSGAYASTDQEVADLYSKPIDVDHDGDVDAADANPFADGSKGDLVNDIAQAVGNLIDLQDGNIFGSTSVYLEGRRVEARTEETNLGDLSADANLWYAQKVDATVLVSIKNGGGIRDSIGNVYAVGGSAVEKPPSANPEVGKEEGDISQLDIANSLRFNNALSLVTVTASQLLQVLEHAVAATTASAMPGQFGQIGGIAFSFDIDNPAGNRVQSAALIDANGNPTLALVENGDLVVDPNMAIRMVTLSFLLTGGDSYPFASFIAANPSFANVVNLTPDLVPDAGQVAGFAAEGTEQDAFAEYLAANYSDTPYNVVDTDRAHDTRIQNLDYRSDTVLAAQPVVLVGDDDDNELSGSLGDDEVTGLGGDDLLSGYAGDDTLDGGEGDDTLLGGSGDDQLAGGEGDDSLNGEAGDDILLGGEGDDTLAGGDGDDVLVGGEGYDTLQGGAGNDRLEAGAGDIVDGGDGDDLIIVSTDDAAPASIDGGAGDDTVKLVGFGAGNLDATLNVENLVVTEGAWSVVGSKSYSNISIEHSGTVNSQITLDNGDHLTVAQGGTLAVPTDGSRVNAIVLAEGNVAVTIDNAGTIGVDTTNYDAVYGNNVTGSVTYNNAATGVTNGSIQLIKLGAGSLATINNAGVMNGGIGVALNFTDVGKVAAVTVNNLAGGVITNSQASFDVIRGGTNMVLNNAGTIHSPADADAVNNPGFFANGGDAVDFNSAAGGVVHNLDGGLIEGSRHAVTGKKGITVTNDAGAVLIGRNGSGINVDNDATAANTVQVTNHGTILGKSAAYDDSDGDAIDTDGLLALDNYGSIRGLGANGYHNGEVNISEGLAIGGGTINNYAGATIYGYGRAIQVDDSGNGAALGAVTITNAGLIQGDGHGAEGVDAADLNDVVLTGREAISIVGGYADSLTNSGAIIGGVSMGGGDDMLVNSGSISATGGSAIDMGEGNDTVTLLAGAAVTGAILLGAGNDTLSGSEGSELISGSGGDDIIDGGAGIDKALYSGAVSDYSFALGANGSVSVTDLRSQGPDGTDKLSNIEQLGFANGDWALMVGTNGDDVITGSNGNDLVFGGSGNDRFFPATLGLDRYDGGDGTDTIDYSQITFQMTVDLDAGLGYVTGYVQGADHLANIENAVGTSYDDVLIGTSGANTLIGGAGHDVLNGGAGDDTLRGGDGNDVLRGGAGNDTVDGGAGYDVLDLSDATGAVTVNLAAATASGAGVGVDHFTGIESFLFGAGNDQVTGGNGDDTFDGGAGNDTINGGAGNDGLGGGAGDDGIDGGSGDDVVSGGIGNDTLKGGSGSDTVDGGEGNDSIDAGSGNDVILAGAGADTVNGGSGNDVIDGGIGNDILTGGSGSDVFVFASGFGKDIITDFAASGSSKDFIQFSTDVFADYAAVMSHTAQVGNSIVMTLDEDHSVTLANTSLASLTADDFRFV